MVHKISAVTLDNPHEEHNTPAVLASIPLRDNAAVPTHAGSAVVCRQNCGSACAPGSSGWRRCVCMNGGISI